ncbi:hypothetical protein SLEP1_g13918 [Rubroshorea leprosula]|uniref:Disease resistance RPP13-like protein 1 n=1 Tax=Rubroshorea leprosula TaxID=152421 RepID=A0AAV5IRH6_9ROSI|nr:hypothetical protein SLEP1_g13918 [Rubroshorea leprosula]
MEILSAAGGAFLTVVFERLFNKLESSRVLNLQEQILTKLRQWESLSLKISALLEDAERTQMFSSNRLVNIWLDDIRDLTYDMEDVLDQFVTDARRSNLTAKPHHASTSKLIPSCFNCFKRSDFVSNSQAISKVDDITRKLQHMIDESKTLNLLSSTTQARDGLNKASTRRLPTTSLPEPYVYGRESDKAAILQKLLNDEGSSSKGFCVVPIYGMGGVGKTTLAQLVYKEVKPESFELKAWVCVSDQINILSITRTILEAVGEKSDSNDLNLLQQKLSEVLSNKKFLLVLDDIWNENPSLWDSLQKPFLSGAAGSKIMITTRSEDVVKIMRGKSKAHHLKLLKDEECLSIFAQCALGADNFNAYPSLKEVGEKIVKKCKGLPLAAKVLGGLLCDELDHSAWEHILRSEIWELQENESGILPALRLSYYYLPSYLKPCFAYCTVFPKDYIFDKNELVLLWMAMGLLQKQNSKEDGHRYFNELVSRTFFERSSGEESRFSKFPSTIGNLIELHHLNIMGTNSLKEMPRGIANLKNLLTLSKFMVGKANGLMRLSDLKNFQQLQGKLSILDLQNVFDIQDAREASLGNIHGLDELLLKWTSDFSNSRDRSNGEMQVLDWLKPHSKLKSLKIVFYGGHKFPLWMGDPLFSNLSYLELKNCERCTLLPSLGLLPILKSLSIEGMKAIEAVGPEFYGHGTFPSLERLVFCNMFNWKKWASPMGSGGEFPRLRDLVIQSCPKLIGQLPSNLSSLMNLEIDGCPELRCSSMSLPLLRDLNIKTCNAALLKSMVDLTSVTSLRIQRISELNCMPKSFVKSLTMLESLSVDSCEELTCLWEEGIEIANLARLETMEIYDCPLLVCLAGKEQGLLPFNLTSLDLQNCGELESLPNVLMMKMDGGSNNILFTPEYLTFRHCSSLKSFPGGKLPTTIISLGIWNCENLESLLDVDNNNLKALKLGDLSSLNSFQGGQLPDSLESFYVDNCKGLESFPERMLQRCTRLEHMVISHCDKLKSLPIFNDNRNLVTLEIMNCEVLESLPGLGSSIPNLKLLEITECKSLKTLSDTIYQLQSLESLCIEDCPSIKCITNGALPANLTSLELYCENLMLLPNNVVELRSLQTLSISDGRLLVGLDLRNLSSLQELAISRTWPPNIVLPSSLTSLEIIDVENLKCISKEILHSLNSLQELHISNCPKLRTLPKEDLPRLLRYLSIENCQHLKQQHFEAKGHYLPLTRNIPYIEIDQNQVMYG